MNTTKLVITLAILASFGVILAADAGKTTTTESPKTTTSDTVNNSKICVTKDGKKICSHRGGRVKGKFPKENNYTSSTTAPAETKPPSTTPKPKIKRCRPGYTRNFATGRCYRVIKRCPPGTVATFPFGKFTCQRLPG